MFRTLTVCIFLSVAIPTTQAEENLNVLPSQIEGGPARQMLSRYLKKRAFAAIDRRDAEYETLKTGEQIDAYQKRLREFFFQQLGSLPERLPLNPRVVGSIDGDGYRIEKIIFESQPKHYVTALLYLPVGNRGEKIPGVLVPCGHTANGKMGYQKPCILLAKNGIAAFCYDPIGQGERYQILDSKGKPRYRSTTEHTLVGASCIPLGRNAATFRVWDGMRALDYLCSREEIDSKRIGCTGNSGGGRLTEYLMALDPRIVCAAPGCAVTSFRRRIETKGPGDAEQNIFGQIEFGMDNADYVIMRAPRPTLLLTATRDFVDIQGAWHVFREAKRIYTRMGFAERVDLVEADEKHGFTRPLREAMVRWMRRWLLKIDEPITEPEIKTHLADELLCTPKGQVLLLDGSRSVADLNVEFDKQLAKQRKEAWLPANREKTLETVRRLAGIRTLRELPRPAVRNAGTFKRPGYHVEKIVLQPEPALWLPALLFKPAKPSGKRVLYLNGNGKHVDAQPNGPIEKLVQQGNVVLAIDLRGAGETGGTNENMWGGNWDDIFLAYLLGKSMVGMRTEDILVAARFLSEWESDDAIPIHLVANGLATAPAVHATAMESRLFTELKLGGVCPSWKEIVVDPSEAGRLADTIHGAL
ncbi:MAG: acetylxylan esterase, partial [Planctomycetota bacterium]|nr:acetylxylan esterase [Planctomycetota bacterium]